MEWKQPPKKQCAKSTLGGCNETYSPYYLGHLPCLVQVVGVGEGRTGAAVHISDSEALATAGPFWTSHWMRSYSPCTHNPFLSYQLGHTYKEENLKFYFGTFFFKFMCSFFRAHIFHEPLRDFSYGLESKSKTGPVRLGNQWLPRNDTQNEVRLWPQNKSHC